MKQTVKTSRVAGQLEKMFRLLNAHFFDGELPEVVISLKKTVGAYGHFTCGKVWQAGDERRYEINISSPTLNRPIEETCATLLHEMCHLACAVGYASKILDADGTPEPIKDTSNNGVYHNKRFKSMAEAHGLEVEHHPKYGWTITSPGVDLLDFIEQQGCRTCRWSRVFPCWMCSERSPRAGAEPKSPVAPANTFAPNVAIAAEQRRQST